MRVYCQSGIAHVVSCPQGEGVVLSNDNLSQRRRSDSTCLDGKMDVLT